eukprot:Blabericola_migrator_1__1671@NODE_144_length_13005_cov_119_784279_g125_i0_p15_GENE_NODE_144_length_13005_cov_119_784279_g125_i0NODE_144_length_13005_cov_119_784279_g125_i0_p15_ORF_typecomplete_len100_score18_61_NODE_144_length_13005_cov_119_784279_g125_i01024110540
MWPSEGFCFKGGRAPLITPQQHPTLQNFPPDYEMVEEHWTDGESTLKVDTEVRLRILGFKYETHGMVRAQTAVRNNVCLQTAVAQIDQDYLGPVEAPEA